VDLNDEQVDQIRRLARYIWWEPSEVAVSDPVRVIAQVMDMGTIEDIIAMERALGFDILREVLRSARPGWFRPVSWAFWHYRLGVTDPADEPPPMPKRTIEDVGA